MTYVENNNNGYVSFDRKNYKLYFDKNSHDDLFKYVNADISDIEDLFKKHVSARMDINTFELKESKTNSFLEKIKDRLICAHPYYKQEYQKIIICEIGTYFNRLLFYSLYKKENSALNSIFSKEWYLEKIRALMPSPSNVKNTPKKDNAGFSNWSDGSYPEGLYPSDFYNYFIKWTKVSEEAADYFEEILIINSLNKLPIGFKNELNCHQAICNMLHFVLDVSVQDLNNLNPHQCLHLYSSMSGEELTIKVHLSPRSRILFQHPTDKDIEKQSIRANAQTVKEHEIFSSLFELNNLNIVHIGNIPQYKLEEFNQVVEYASLSDTPKIYEEYEIENLYQLLYLEILSMVRAGTLIKKCKNCGKYFIPTRKNTVYCNHIYKSEKSCHELRTNINFKNKLSNDQPLSAYIKSYKTHHARIKKGKMTENEFHNWKNEAKHKLTEVREGNLNIKTYMEWLKI